MSAGILLSLNFITTGTGEILVSDFNAISEKRYKVIYYDVVPLNIYARHF